MADPRITSIEDGGDYAYVEYAFMVDGTIALSEGPIDLRCHADELQGVAEEDRAEVIRRIAENDLDVHEAMAVKHHRTMRSMRWS